MNINCARSQLRQAESKLMHAGLVITDYDPYHLPKSSVFLALETNWLLPCHMKVILYFVLSLKIQNAAPIRPPKRARLGIHALAVLGSYHLMRVFYALRRISRGKINSVRKKVAVRSTKAPHRESKRRRV